MNTNDQGLHDLKHRVMLEVCRMAWDDCLTHEEREKVTKQIIPGPKPTLRCCIYKEREIIRGRIRLAMGIDPDVTRPTDNIVAVIPAACDDCPIQDHMVTDSCRFCLGRACLSACRFGAISPGDTKMKIDPTKCKSCGLCAKACPFHAIVHSKRPCQSACPAGAISYDEYGLCIIDDKKCIRCGHCIHTCPFGAIGSKIFLVDIIKAIKAGKRVIAMCAPATEGQFDKDHDMATIRSALIEAGFADMVEVGLGADMTAACEAKEWIEAKKEGRRMTTSCCPAFINMMQLHFPKVYKENMSSIVSPMVAVSRYLKFQDPDCVTVFIGPCIAKKAETKNETIADRPDYAITYGEMVVFLRSRGIEITQVEPTGEKYQEASLYGKNFAGSGGVADAVLEAMKEMGEDTSDISLLTCAGGEECRRALLLLQNNRLKEDFVEGMMCPGGCIGGPSKHETEPLVIKARNALLQNADQRKILENLEDYPMDQFSMFRDGHLEDNSAQ